MTKLERFLRRRHRPFRRQVRNGSGHVAVDFYDGYVVIRSTQPGVHWDVEVAIERSAWWALLRQVVAPSRLMAGPDFDRNVAEREYLASLALLEKQSKAARKAYDQDRHTQAKRQRYLRAKARGRR